MSQNHLSRDEDTVNAWPPVPSFPGEAGAQRHPLLQEKRRTMNARRESTLRIEPTCRTPSDTTAPLALRKSAREKTSLGSGVIVAQLKRGNYAYISGEFTT